MWYVIAVILGLLLIALAVLQLIHIYRAYQGSTGTTKQKFLAAFKHSATILLARATAFGAAAVAWLVNFFPSLDPTSGLGQAIAAVLKPAYTPFYALGFALLFEVVRRRPGSVDPITPPALK